jgi:predicted ribosome quality control (RQC) complex YloA/Tae2 family protein
VSSRGRPYRRLTVLGYEVLVGRGDEENDRLTFEVAAPGDFWLHVGGGVAGSHVVVRNPEGLDALPPPVLAEAAALAVWHSRARGRRADVHLCQAGDVAKRRGAPAGEVILRRWRRVRVPRGALPASIPPGADRGAV